MRPAPSPFPSVFSTALAPLALPSRSRPAGHGTARILVQPAGRIARLVAWLMAPIAHDEHADGGGISQAQSPRLRHARAR